MSHMKESWQIAATRFCVEKPEFTFQELRIFLESEPYKIPDGHITAFFRETIQHPSGRQFNRQERLENDKRYWTATVDMASTIIDYDELKDARKNARHAFWISMGALAVSALGAYFQFLSI